MVRPLKWYESEKPSEYVVSLSSAYGQEYADFWTFSFGIYYWSAFAYVYALIHASQFVETAPFLRMSSHAIYGLHLSTFDKRTSLYLQAVTGIAATG